MCSIEEVGVFEARLTLYEFLLGWWFIWINIKHLPKGVNQLYPIGNAGFIEGNLEYSKEYYIAYTALFGFLYGTI